MQSILSKKSRSILLHVLLFCFVLPLHTRAQNVGPGYQTALSYRWEIKTPDAVPQPVLLLKNNGSTAIPAAGWSLYFNSIKKPFLAGGDSAKYQIKHINGDLFRFNIKPGVAALEPGQSVPVQIAVPEIRNFTEVPAGFYLVYDNNPGEGYLLKNTTPINNTIEPAVALVSYKKNEQFAAKPAANAPLVLPTPLSYTKKQGVFLLTSKTVIVAPAAFRAEAELLADDLAVVFGIKSLINTKPVTGPAITLAAGKSQPEGYTLTAGAKGIIITANKAAGIFYGIQSLKTLLPPQAWAAKQTSIQVPAVDIIDAPRFGHRAFMLDVARNFQPKKEILKVLDVMALYKMNVLHFHLNDDEGWRIEIPGLPELTEVGARRGHSADAYAMLPPSYGSGPGADNKFGTGYYTRQDYLEILKYAHARHITVIPEIESPGHARAAIRAIDARYQKYLKQGLRDEATRYLLRDTNDASVYRSVQGWSDNVINPALPSTYTFIDKVVGEITKMYTEAKAPLKTIHMGGDEVPEGVWAGSPAANDLLKRDTSINGVYGLWKYYFGTVNNILKKQGLYLSGWEEIGLKRTVVNNRKKWVLDPSVSNRGYTADVWNNIIGTGAEDLAYNLANQGFRVVLSNVTNMYLDMAYNNSFYEHGMNWAGFVDIDKPFYFIPYNYYTTTTEDEYGKPVAQSVFNNKAKLATHARANITGLQTALWSETLVADSLLHYLLLPKLLGAAERSWTKDPEWSSQSAGIFTGEAYKQSWANFTATVGQRELPRLDHYQGGFAYRIPEPGVQCANGTVKANTQLPGFVIKYTLNGTEPDNNSSIYTAPITAKGTVTLRLFNKEGRGGKSVSVNNN